MGELIPSTNPLAPPRQFSYQQHQSKYSGSSNNQQPWQLELKSLDEKWKYLFSNQLFTDVSLIVGPGQEFIETHRLLLILHSPVFESMLSARWSRSSSSSSITTTLSSSSAQQQQGQPQEELYLPEDSPKIIKLLLNCIYESHNAKVLSSASVEDTLSLLLMAKKYICPHVISQAIAHLKLNISETNVIQIYQTSVFVDELELQNYTENFILTKACNLARVGEFSKFSPAELEYFVRRDDLNIDEVELFNAVYKWAQDHCAAAAAASSACTSDSEDGSEAGKASAAGADRRRSSSISEALENILPLIRFPCMSLEDFSVQVVSKSVLPLPETVQVYKYLSTPAEAVDNSAAGGASADDLLKFCKQPRSRKIFTYIFKRLKGHGFDFGRKWQNLVFQVDQNIRLMSLGFFRAVKPSASLTVGIKILNYELDQLLYEFEEESANCTVEDDVFHIKLPKPFEISKNLDYTISYIIKGDETFYKSSEPISVQLACCTDKRITFAIKESVADTDLDQLPEMCFQLFG